MDKHVREFFAHPGSGEQGPIGHFHEVIALHDHPDMSWKEIQAKIPQMPRGWYELVHLSVEDRIEFTSQYWASKLTLCPRLDDMFQKFFKSLDDIGVFVIQKKYDDPYDAVMVYSLADNRGFYRGALPASYDDCVTLQTQFSEHLFPEDYIGFLQIHDGFSKTTDATGIIPSKDVESVYQRFQSLIAEDEITTRKGLLVDPKSLIPFYESFGMPFFQCFWDEWHQEQGMGNVYYSMTEKTISDPTVGEPGAENLTFPTFSDWLVFYLERID